MKSALPISDKLQLDSLAHLSDADREAVRLLSLAVYPPETLADWPGRHIEWSSPEWCVRLWDNEGVLVSYVGVHVRDATCDGRPILIGGVGGVKTRPSARGRGFAGLGLRRAIKFFDQHSKVDFALLVCEPRLLGFYERLGWHEFHGQLRVQQRGIPVNFTFNRVMTYPIGAEVPDSGVIDLCGPPW
jgi:hypothetical protein